MLLIEKDIIQNVDSTYVIDTVNIMYEDKIIKYVDAADVADILQEVKLSYIQVFFDGEKMHPIYITPLYCIVPMWSESYMDYQPLYKIHAIMRDYRKRKVLKYNGNPFIDTHFETQQNVCLYILISTDYGIGSLALKVLARYQLVTNKHYSVVVQKKMSLWDRFIKMFY